MLEQSCTACPRQKIRTPDADSLVLTAATPRLNALLKSDKNVALQHVLEKISQQHMWNQLSKNMATASYTYEEAASLPPMEELGACLEVVETQRALHLQRHPYMDTNAVFSYYDIQEIFNAWMEDGSWMPHKQKQEYR